MINLMLVYLACLYQIFYVKSFVIKFFVLIIINSFTPVLIKIRMGVFLLKGESDD